MIGRLLLVTAIGAVTIIFIHEFTKVRERHRRYPPVTKAHLRVHGNVISYEKFRARRLLDEKNRR